MRARLAGFKAPLPPLVFSLTNGIDFPAAQYITAGYTNYDVICIGGAGGSGGGYDIPSDTDTNRPQGDRAYGSAGGGGGIMRKQGLLSTLPASVSVKVGAAGADAPDVVGYTPSTVEGSDGGSSWFDGATCRASGGKGGGRVILSSPGSGVQLFTFNTGGTLGQGGIGGQLTAGGGANGSAGGANASEGTWNGSIGSGGGGGRGGSYRRPSKAVVLPAYAGGRGAVLGSDMSVYGPAGDPRSVFNPALSATINGVLPGFAGGANPNPVSGGSTMYYGSKVAGFSGTGCVIVRVTKV